MVFIETTQIGAALNKGVWPYTLADDTSVAQAYWRTDFTTPTQPATAGSGTQTVPPPTTPVQYADTGPGVIASPGWGEYWPGGGSTRPRPRRPTKA